MQIELEITYADNGNCRLDDLLEKAVRPFGIVTRRENNATDEHGLKGWLIAHNGEDCRTLTFAFASLPNADKGWESLEHTLCEVLVPGDLWKAVTPCYVQDNLDCDDDRYVALSEEYCEYDEEFEDNGAIHLRIEYTEEARTTLGYLFMRNKGTVVCDGDGQLEVRFDGPNYRLDWTRTCTDLEALYPEFKFFYGDASVTTHQEFTSNPWRLYMN
ncbi:MAG: hypothetical protein ACLP9L_10860 [Thermoguttaceae bacterium]